MVRKNNVVDEQGCRLERVEERLRCELEPACTCSHHPTSSGRKEHEHGTRRSMTRIGDILCIRFETVAMRISWLVQFVLMVAM